MPLIFAKAEDHQGDLHPHTIEALQAISFLSSFLLTLNVQRPDLIPVIDQSNENGEEWFRAPLEMLGGMKYQRRPVAQATPLCSDPEFCIPQNDKPHHKEFFRDPTW